MKHLQKGHIYVPLEKDTEKENTRNRIREREYEKCVAPTTTRCYLLERNRSQGGLLGASCRIWDLFVTQSSVACSSLPEQVTSAKSYA